ncbi:MAG TPA: hypothetical protein VHN79_05205, partial [Lacunisphaera sp.]|nr:hypothetical protein [Lacunisphaera sp.]
TNEPGLENRVVAGVDHRLPLLVESRLWVDSQGEVRASARKRFQLTNRTAAFVGAQYDTATQWEWTGGVEHLVSKRFSLVAQHHSEHGLGGGLQWRF